MGDNKDIIRDSIADLLTDNDINLTDDIDSQTLNFNRVPSTISKNDMVTLEQSRQKAKNVMESLLRVYLSDNFISKNEYVKAKVNLDSMTLGNIMNQMEVSQRAIQILMDNIELGDVNPKLFEELGKLVYITYTVLPGTHSNLTGFVAVNKALFGKFHKVNALI